jgi:hypothetical protein
MKGYRLDCSSCSPLNGARVFRHGKQYGFNMFTGDPGGETLISHPKDQMKSRGF